MKVDVKVTLQRLHEKFPQFGLDDLFAVLDCIYYEYEPVPWPTATYTQDYCTTDCSTGSIKANHTSME